MKQFEIVTAQSVELRELERLNQAVELRRHRAEELQTARRARRQRQWQRKEEEARQKMRTQAAFLRGMAAAGCIAAAVVMGLTGELWTAIFPAALALVLGGGVR